jgi:hypothetical protein
LATGAKADSAPRGSTRTPQANEQAASANQKGQDNSADAGAKTEPTAASSSDAAQGASRGDDKADATAEDPTATSDSTDEASSSAPDRGEMKVIVDGVGDMPSPPPPPKTPQEASQKAQADSGAADAEAGDDDGQSVQALLDAMDAQKRAGTKMAKVEALDQRAERPSGGPPGGGGGAGHSDARNRSPVGDWADYAECTRLYAPEIMQARRLLVQIQERQSRLVQRPTAERDLLPEGNDFGLFDAAAHEALVKKIARRQPVNEHDARRFAVRVGQIVPAAIDIVIKIDGSGSMGRVERNWDFSALDGAMQTACILNEAAQKPRARANSHAKEGDINVWAYVWGNDPPDRIAAPGDNPRAIAAAIAGIRDERPWGTSLSPAIRTMTTDLHAAKVDPQKQMGFTHVFVFSDGDIDDGELATLDLDLLFRATSRLTYDVIVVSSKPYLTDMEKTIKAIQAQHGEARIKTIRCLNPGQAHAATLALLRERMVSTLQTQARPARERKKELGRALSLG